MAKIDVMFSSKTDQWATPPDFFEELDREFHFDLDPCAGEENHKCARYFTREQNGLLQDWGGVPCILQPAIRQRDRRLGAQGLRRRAQREHPGRYAYTGKN